MASRFQASRMDDIPFSSIRAVFEQVAQMKARGQNVIPFHIGRPDFDTPNHIKVAAKQALDDGLIAYTSNYGLIELREALAGKLAEDNHIHADPNTEIAVTVGANEAVFMAMMGTLNPGDEVLIPDPMWLHYFYCAHMAGAKVVSVPLLEKNGFQLDPDDIKARITNRTRMIVINTPHNPTGVVFSLETLQAVAELAVKHDLLLLADEIYEKIIYDNLEHISLASFSGLEDRVITINGFSKSYAMTGWRLGYVVAPQSIMDALIRVHQYTTVCATSFAQAGAIAALNGPQSSITDMVTAFDARRRVIVDAFSGLSALSLVKPGGAFYAFPNVRALGENSAEVAQQLMEHAHIAVVPGAAFGQYGEGYVRIAYSCALPDVQQGMANLGAYVG